MNEFREEYIQYRLVKARESLKDAEVLAKNERWNTCVSRLYYACFYVVSALLLKHKIKSHTHPGTKSQFNQHFVKTGKVLEEEGKLFVKLMAWRYKGDYGDMFDFNKETVEPLFEPVEQFLKTIEMMVNKE